MDDAAAKGIDLLIHFSPDFPDEVDTRLILGR
jgi:hypothetical protein